MFCHANLSPGMSGDIFLHPGQSLAYLLSNSLLKVEVVAPEWKTVLEERGLQRARKQRKLPRPNGLMQHLSMGYGTEFLNFVCSRIHQPLPCVFWETELVRGRGLGASPFLLLSGSFHSSELMLVPIPFPSVLYARSTSVENLYPC